MGTGGAVHNLRQLQWSKKKAPGDAWAVGFENWIVEALIKKDVDALLTADEQPDFKRAHPSNEHFLPIYFTIGAALPGDELNILFRGVEYGSLSMLSFYLNHHEPNSFH
jgi:4,5-DOPA dioxygenase extradiol